jgi:hypothetical protein
VPAANWCALPCKPPWILKASIQQRLVRAESPAGAGMADTLLLRTVEKAAELDCDIRWADLAHALAGPAAAGEEGSDSDAGNSDEEDAFARLATEDAAAEANGDGGDDVHGQHLSRCAPTDPACQLGAHSIVLALVQLPLWIVRPVHVQRILPQSI